jgi:hypothetical protein
MEQMVQRYPDDYEVQVFYALTLQASAPKADLTYANQLKSVAILEKLYDQNPQHPGPGRPVPCPIGCLSSSLTQRLAKTSLREIDDLILELQRRREELPS